MNQQSRMRALRRAILPVALSTVTLVGGCAIGPQLVRTEVTNFNEWAALPADRSYTFARTLEYQNSLAVQAYEDIVRDELAMQGFQLAPDPAQANLVVTLRPSIVTTQLRIRDPFPYYGGYGPFGGGWYGGFGGYGFAGRRGWFDPFWSDFSATTVEVVHRRLELDIDSRTTAGKRFYEGRVESTSDAPSLGAIAPYLVRALFTDFPGGNGQTRRVDLPLSRP